MQSESYIAGLELGGSGCKIAISNPQNIESFIDFSEIKTTTPEETLQAICSFLQNKNISKLGIASFGPIEIHEDSPDYGNILNTPKKQWQNFPILKKLKDALQVPCFIDTDVNAAAIAEKLLRRPNTKVLVYITVGTGIGMGIISDNKTRKGYFGHPEAGHLSVPRHPEDEKNNFTGACSFHQNCIEGMVAIGGIAKRLNVTFEQLPQIEDSHQVWDIVSYYLAYLCLTINYVIIPETIILGGGVMLRKSLLPKIKEWYKKLAGGYIFQKQIDQIDNFLLQESFQNRAGILGALMVAQLES